MNDKSARTPPLSQVVMHAPEINSAHYVSECYGGTIIAGAIYPTVMLVCMFVAAVLAGEVGLDVGIGDLVGAALSVVFTVLIGGVLGAVVAALVGMVGLVLATTLNATMGNSIPPRICAILAGGFSLFVPMSWLLFVEPPANSPLVDRIIPIMLGPVLAIVVASVVVDWYARHHVDPYHSLPHNEKRTGFKIGIWHLMVATTWFALTFGIANALGRRFVIAAIVWLTVQTACLLLLSTINSVRQSNEYYPDAVK